MATQREKLAVTRHLTARVTELEAELAAARRPLVTLRDIAAEKRRLRKSTVWAWREVEQLLANSPLDN